METPRNRIEGWTQADGTFELRLVPPGEYVLGFNLMRRSTGRFVMPRAFYPGVTESASAAIVTVAAAGQRVPLNDFVIPESIKLVPINGIVVDEAGQPVRDATVILRVSSEGGDIIGPPFMTGSDGQFAFTVVEGGKYDLHVTRYLGTDIRTRQSQISIVPFAAAGLTETLRVVMRPRKY